MNSIISIGSILALTAFATASSTAQILKIEAESGSITPPFIVTNGYLFQPLETGLTNGGSAVYSFTITNPGYYTITAVVNSTAPSSNSFYVNIDSQPVAPSMIWDISPTVGFMERPVTERGASVPQSSPAVCRVFPLSAGLHRLIIRGRGANVQLHHLSITMLDPPAPPGNLRVVTP